MTQVVEGVDAVDVEGTEVPVAVALLVELAVELQVEPIWFTHITPAARISCCSARSSRSIGGARAIWVRARPTSLP